MKKLINMLLSSKYTLRERLFLAGGLVGTISMVVAFILSVVSGESLFVGLAPGVGALIVGGTTYYSMKTKNIDFGASVITLISTCLLLPYGFMRGGGIYSGSASWFIVGFVIIFLFFKGKKFYFFFILSIISFAATVYISYIHPEYVTQLGSDKAIYFDAFMAAVVIGALVGILQHFQSEILEKEIKVSADQHKKIEKLNEAQNRFFSSMSHEIRTPINTIIGLNEMTLREKNLSEEAVENSLNIQNASRMLLSLINDILDLSKIQSGQMDLTEGQYETSRVLSEIVNLLWNRAKDKGLQFNVNVGEKIPSMLYGDEMRIKQVIVNLLTNAIKYTQEGSVTLIIDGNKTNTNIFELQITVQDTGQGIRKENLPIIFDSFKRFEGQDNKMIEGTGLGLTITKQLVDLMGGKISVDSIYTKGSTFKVVIPQKIVSETPINFKTISETNREMEHYQQSFEAPEARVLVVDDNDMNRMVCRKLLRETKVKVDVASSGKECLEKTLQTRYHAVFMDHEMPELDGVETLQRMRVQPNGLCHDTPVIALTANAGSDRNAFYLENGFQAYLAKPIHGSLLEATLLQVLPSELIENSINTKEEEVVQVVQNKRKKAIAITTDCICDLPNEVLNEYDIKTMPYYIITQDGRFRDTSEINADNLYEHLRNGDKIETQASSIDEYESFFGEILTEAETVIHFTASKDLSEGYSRALQASKSFDHVQVVDSRSLSTGIGFQVIKAAEMAAKGARVDEIIEAIDEYRDDIVINFLIPSIENVHRSSHQSLLSRIFVKAFNFQASFAMKKGLLKVQRFFLGYLNDPLIQYIRSNFAGKKNIDTSELYIIYSGYSEEERQAILSEIEKHITFEKVVMQKCSATLTANCGIHSLAFAYAKIRENKEQSL